MKTIGLIHGPNLDRLGKREPHIYGKTSLTELETRLQVQAKKKSLILQCFQSNHEGLLIDKIASWADQELSGLIYNFGALTHTSIALHDSLAATSFPKIEVHISNLYQRESFRHHSFTASVAIGVISGLGIKGYDYALDYLSGKISS